MSSERMPRHDRRTDRILGSPGRSRGYQPNVKHLARQLARPLSTERAILASGVPDNVQHEFNFQLPSRPSAADVGR